MVSAWYDVERSVCRDLKALYCNDVSEPMRQWRKWWFEKSESTARKGGMVNIVKSSVGKVGDDLIEV